MSTPNGNSRPAPGRGRKSTNAPARRRRAKLPPGTVVERYKELLGPVQEGTRMYIFKPGSTGMANLDAKASMYEMYRLRGPVHVSYKAAVGTTTAGQVLLGVDYDPNDAALTYQATAALSPKAVCPAWKDTSLSIPPGRAMKQKWLYTDTEAPTATAYQGADLQFGLRPETAAFGLQVSSTATGNPGSLWIEYNLEFCSPRQQMKIGSASLMQQPNGQEPNNATQIMRLTTASVLSNVMMGIGSTVYALFTGKPNETRLNQLLGTGVSVQSIKKCADLGWTPNPSALPSNNPGNVVFDPHLVTLNTTPATDYLFTNVPPITATATTQLLWMLLTSQNVRGLRRFVEGGVKTWET